MTGSNLVIVLGLSTISQTVTTTLKTSTNSANLKKEGAENRSAQLKVLFKPLPFCSDVRGIPRVLT
ncbi:MAG: hypothetical protein JWQ54_15 [Mucilaginibacter sp.]|nr:hypothetical protein [Mucilaginibacter sp.]